jgi:hypothetical protein
MLSKTNEKKQRRKKQILRVKVYKRQNVLVSSYIKKTRGAIQSKGEYCIYWRLQAMIML